MKIQRLNPDSLRPMLIRYSHPFQELETMRRQFDRLFNELAPTRSEQAKQSEQPEPTDWTPAIELNDEGNAFTLRVQLPGLEAKDIDIQVSRGAVAIAGEHRHQRERGENGILRSEFRYGKFHRIVRLPAAVQNDKVQAEYKDGVLHLTLPKTPETKNQVVKVNLVDSSDVSTSGAAPESEANS